MTKLENMAADEFKKLPKKKQKEINKAKRIPVAKPGHEFNKSNVRCKLWNTDELWRYYMKGFDLPVMDGTRKSFYGKAKVIEHDNGDICLISYSTLVARIHNGNFEKLWDGYSATTMRHINSFLLFYNLPGGGKLWWNKLEVVA